MRRSVFSSVGFIVQHIFNVFIVLQAEAVLMQQEEKELLKEIQRVEEALKEEDAQNQHLQQQVEVRPPPV